MQTAAEHRSTEVLASSLNSLSHSFSALFGDSVLDHWHTFLEVAQTVFATLETCNIPEHRLAHILLGLSTGQVMLHGKQAHGLRVSAADWLSMMVTLLCHDVGYQCGICSEDDMDGRSFWVGSRNWVTLEVGASEAALRPYRVNRSQQYVREALSGWPLVELERVVDYIDITRFPIPEIARYQDTCGYGGLCRAAELISQLIVPRYLDNLSILFCEFAETDLNQELGRLSLKLPANYLALYWQEIYPYIQGSLSYLAATSAGRKRIAQLYTNMYLVQMRQGSH